jgi:hypothetical protein
MSALDLTRAGLIRALGGALAARPAVDAAVRARAEAIAARLGEAGAEARVVRRGDGDYAVEAGGPVEGSLVSPASAKRETRDWET